MSISEKWRPFALIDEGDEDEGIAKDEIVPGEEPEESCIGEPNRDDVDVL